MVPRIMWANGSRFMASRSRWSRYQAVSGVRPCIRSISRALIPFLAEHICTMTISQTSMGTFVPWKIVPVRTENCLRHLAHFQTRRWLMVRFGPVARLVPLAGFRK